MVYFLIEFHAKNLIMTLVLIDLDGFIISLLCDYNMRLVTRIN